MDHQLGELRSGSVVDGLLSARLAFESLSGVEFIGDALPPIAYSLNAAQ
jgi:hypothetical protein